jgi:glycosyltransferase involved in cell wall biosynthesis
MNHIIITRAKFDDDTLFDKYFEISKKFYIPSLYQQTNKNFEIGLIINLKHKKNFDDCLPKDIKVNYFENFDEYKDYVFKNNINIQTRHDIDDGMTFDYIDTIQILYSTNIEKFENFIIHAQPIKIDVSTNKKYFIKEFNDTYNSMFLSLCQKNTTNSVFEKKHGNMFELTKNIVKIQDPKVYLIFHGNNKNTDLRNTDILIDEQNNYFDLSIIIPTYDNIQYIDESINSLLKSMKNTKCEILIGIDNCEKTKNYITNNLIKFPNNIRFFYFNQNVGPYIVRNSLTKVTNSDKLFFFDSDDVANENLIPTIFESLKKYDVVRYKFWNFNEPNSYKNQNNLKLNDFYSQGQFGIKKEKFNILNGFEPWLCGADSEFKLRESFNKLTCININEPLIYRRRHGQNLTMKKETGHNSEKRNYYNSLLSEKKLKKNFNPLKELKISSFSEILSKTKIKSIINVEDIDKIKTKELSIIVPTYNNENYLDECLNSIIKSVKNLDCEILVGIDKCEKTLQKIKEQKFDNRIKFFYFNKNLGPYIIKNSLSKESKSDYLLFFDSDDIMGENMISEIYPKIKQVDFIKPMYLDFQNGQKINSVTKTNKYGEGVFAIKKNLFLQMNGFEPWRCAADSDFMGRLYKNNKKFLFTTDVVFYRRVHSNSLTQNPETCSWSKLRAQYYKLSKSKKTFGPLPELVTEIFEQVFVETELTKYEFKFEPKKEQKAETLNKIFSSKKPKNTEVKEINYNVINQVTQNKGVYIPKKNIPIRENKPNDRNKLIELKKGENNKQIKELFKSKPNRRNNLPNIF